MIKMVEIGDTVIIFQRPDGSTYALPGGISAESGDDTAIHPTPDTKDGMVTHGLDTIDINDTVIVRPSTTVREGYVALKPGIACLTGSLIDEGVGTTCPGGRYGGKGDIYYTYDFGKPFYVNGSPGNPVSYYEIDGYGQTEPSGCNQEWYIPSGIWLWFSDQLSDGHDSFTTVNAGTNTHWHNAFYNPAGSMPSGGGLATAAEQPSVRMDHMSFWAVGFNTGPYRYVTAVVHNTPLWQCCIKSYINSMKICKVSLSPYE
jgi:hypothetical protein